jgi:CheY-like chemotaxis protein/anti-sigma regulatory factor (Ser/Thr protein kinase)
MFIRFVIIDDSKYQQIFLNILSNSIKYTYTGCITVKVSTHDHWLSTEISDTGMGISKEILDNMYDLFQHTEAKILTCSTGIGMGLAITKKLIDYMKGEIDIKSTVGVGTSVIFKIQFKTTPNKRVNSMHALPILPLQLTKTDGESTVIPSTPTLKMMKKEKHILIVDDTVFHIFALKKMLNSIKITSVYEAYNGYQAVTIFQEKLGEIALILMDINMPKMNGFEAAIEINAIIKSKRIDIIPIVALSAQNDDSYLNTAVQSGICRYGKLLNQWQNH